MHQLAFLVDGVDAEVVQFEMEADMTTVRRGDGEGLPDGEQWEYYQ